MPLSEDSRALLTLLLGRGKSYADISGLLGVDEAEVRRRASAAVGEIDPSVGTPDQDLTDYLLGQADAITEADVSTRIAADPELKDRADSIADQLRLLVPGAAVPSGGASKAAPKKAATPNAPADTADSEQSDSSPSGFASITSHQRRLIAVLVGAALLAAVVILLVTGAFSGSDDNPETAEPSPTVAVLQPVGNQQGSGQIQFGFSGTNLAANVQISDLKPNGKNDGYVLWLDGATGSFPFYATKVNESGTISGQVTNLNEAVICLIASDFFPTIRVSRADNKEFNQALKRSSVSKEEDVKLPKYTGTTVLEGTISMPQEAKDTIVPICNGTANQTQTE